MHSKSGTSNDLDPLGPHTDTAYDRANEIVTLYIWDVQAKDAGYYVLVSNTGSQILPNSSAVLFVYGMIHFLISQK